MEKTLCGEIHEGTSTEECWMKVHGTLNWTGTISMLTLRFYYSACHSHYNADTLS
jgi:hypothetical protein